MHETHFSSGSPTIGFGLDDSSRQYVATAVFFVRLVRLCVGFDTRPASRHGLWFCHQGYMQLRLLPHNVCGLVCSSSTQCHYSLRKLPQVERTKLNAHRERRKKGARSLVVLDKCCRHDRRELFSRCVSRFGYCNGLQASCCISNVKVGSEYGEYVRSKVLNWLNETTHTRLWTDTEMPPPRAQRRADLSCLPCCVIG